MAGLSLSVERAGGRSVCFTVVKAGRSVYSTIVNAGRSVYSTMVKGGRSVRFRVARAADGGRGRTEAVFLPERLASLERGHLVRVSGDEVGAAAVVGRVVGPGAGRAVHEVTAAGLRLGWAQLQAA